MGNSQTRYFSIIESFLKEQETKYALKKNKTIESIMIITVIIVIIIVMMKIIMIMIVD